LRAASDLDFLVSEKVVSDKGTATISNHEEDLVFHEQEKDELIYNPKYHFYFNDLKFVSFDQVFLMKKNRGYLKDKYDCEMQEGLMRQDTSKRLRANIKQKLNYLLIKLRARIIVTLKRHGLYDRIRKIYKTIFGF
jgi:hypothetical protein